MIYSDHLNKVKGRKWFRGGKKIQYYQNHIIIDKEESVHQRYYTLQFIYTFPADNDVVSFAWSQPYTFTKLQRYLETLDKNVGL